jgi:methyltransferase (TIGR00027 family)
MITRTKLIDDRIAACLSAGCDRVLNLAAGLDTRPYRLDLPRDLDWIEADLPAMVDEKERQLAGETPRCRLRRERVDLADRAARADFLARATSGATKVLVITEGLLTYLDDDQVRELGRDLLRPPIRWWVLDVASPAIVKMMMRGMGAQLQKAPLKFAPAFFEQLGWRVRDILSIFRSAVRFHRVPLLLRLFSLLPEPDPRRPGNGRWSAVDGSHLPGCPGRAGGLRRGAAGARRSHRRRRDHRRTARHRHRLQGGDARPTRPGAGERGAARLGGGWRGGAHPVRRDVEEGAPQSAHSWAMMLGAPSSGDRSARCTRR